MRLYLSLVAVTASFILSIPCQAQDDVRVMYRKLKADIENSYKAKALTDEEYNKMLEEHKTIGKAIESALIDAHLSPEESNKIEGKINRSKKRLIKYKGNNKPH